MKKYLLLFIAAISLTFAGCDHESDFTPPNYVTFAENSARIGVDIDGSTTYDVIVYTANEVSEDRTFNVNVAGATTLAAAGYDVPETVTVPGGTNEGMLSFTVSDEDLGLLGKSLVLSLDSTGDLSTGDNASFSVFRTCEGTEFEIDFAFDGYASETGWKLTDSEGNVVVEVAQGTYDDGTSSDSRSYCLGAGTYTFAITDSYGDGLTYPNMGSVTISYAGTVLETIDGDFGGGTSVDVTF